MKNFKTTFSVMFAFVATVLFQSCSDGNDTPNHMAIVTTRVMAGDDGEVGDDAYYFEMDNSKTLTPMINRVENHEAVEGQRALIYYDIEDNSVVGFDYGIKLFSISKILTKDIEMLTNDNEDEVGYDPVMIVTSSFYTQLSGGYLNLKIKFPTGSSNATVRLVKNKVITPYEDTDDYEGYTVLELRLNNPGSELSNRYSMDYVSFKLGDYDPRMTRKKGIKVIAKLNNSEELKTYTFPFEADVD